MQNLNSVQQAIADMDTEAKAVFLRHYRPFVYETFIEPLLRQDDGEKLDEEVNRWAGSYMETISEDDLQAVHAIDQAREWQQEQHEAFAEVLADIVFDGDPPEIHQSDKQPWER
jgi:hypothetical protein